MFTRHGALREEVSEIPYLTDPDADPALVPLHAAACIYRMARGPRAVQKVLAWKDPSVRLANPEIPQSQGCVSAQGFSLHADTWCGPQQRQKLERLCRDITRPALSHECEGAVRSPIPRSGRQGRKSWRVPVPLPSIARVGR